MGNLHGGVLLTHLVEIFFTLRGDIPRVRPEAQIDAPPIARHARRLDRRDQFVEVQLAGAERVVSRGVVFVQTPVAVDQVDMGDIAPEFFKEFHRPARKGFFGSDLVGPH